MEVKFWGARGSLPASQTAETIYRKVRRVLEIAVEKKIGPETDIDAFMEKELSFGVRGTYGTNTSSVQIGNGGDEGYIICDAGSGIRDFGNHILAKHGHVVGQKFNIFLSHSHWDHIHGFPFFTPAYMKGAQITVYGGHDNLEEVFSAQQKAPFFPVDFSLLGAEIKFVTLKTGKKHRIAGFDITVIEQNHPGLSYGYRFEKNGKAVVYSTDCEHKLMDVANSPFVDFFNNADLLIFDAQYVFADACTFKEDWGHSSNIIGVELAKESKVKHLCLFHLEPTMDDEALEVFLEDTEKYANLAEGETLKVSMAYDGLIIEV